MQKFYILSFLLLPFTITSQTIQGKVYDEDSTVKGAKIVNTTQNILTYSDNQGNFKIEARVNDSIVFQSLFHLKQTFNPKKDDFNEVIVIALKKILNELDEVLIKKEADFTEFDPVVVNTTLKNQILEDIKRNPHLYGKSSGNGNILNVIGLIAKLFKSKKPKAVMPTSATYVELVQFFETDSYFNQTFLKKELKISDDFKFLFLQYCEAQNIDSKLLLHANQFMLLDTFLKCSNEFHEILNEKKD